MISFESRPIERIDSRADATTAGTAPVAWPAATRSPFADSIARLKDAWDAGDGGAWGVEFWMDATFVNILGVSLHGAPAIAAVHERIFAGPFRGSTIALEIAGVRSPSTSIALVDVTTRVTNFSSLPPGAVQTSPGVLETRFLFVYERRQATWHIEAAHNTAIVTPNV